MDNVKALGEAIEKHDPKDALRCNAGCAQEIVRNLYEAGFLITEVPEVERTAVRTIADAMDRLTPESQQKVMRKVVAAHR